MLQFCKFVVEKFSEPLNARRLAKLENHRALAAPRTLVESWQLTTMEEELASLESIPNPKPADFFNLNWTRAFEVAMRRRTDEIKCLEWRPFGWTALPSVGQELEYLCYACGRSWVDVVSETILHCFGSSNEQISSQGKFHCKVRVEEIKGKHDFAVTVGVMAVPGKVCEICLEDNKPKYSNEALAIPACPPVLSEFLNAVRSLFLSISD